MDLYRGWVSVHRLIGYICLPCRLSEENHLRSIASKYVNVFVHPFHSLSLVKKTRVHVMTIQSCCLWKTKYVQAIADTNISWCLPNFIVNGTYLIATTMTF